MEENKKNEELFKYAIFLNWLNKYFINENFKWYKKVQSPEGTYRFGIRIQGIIVENCPLNNTEIAERYIEFKKRSSNAVTEDLFWTDDEFYSD